MTVLENYKLTVLSNCLNWNSDFYSFAESSVIEGPHFLVCNELLTEFSSQSRKYDIKFLVLCFVIMADLLNNSRMLRGGAGLVHPNFSFSISLQLPIYLNISIDKTKSLHLQCNSLTNAKQQFLQFFGNYAFIYLLVISNIHVAEILNKSWFFLVSLAAVFVSSHNTPPKKLLGRSVECNLDPRALSYSAPMNEVALRDKAKNDWKEN